jgi:glyoxylase-like metal-dependent hydrolase (beta-lactamase superfamily II)
MTGYSKGLHDIGLGHFAYLQPLGTWGYSNAGLITDGEAALLVDTLFDERLTAEMLQTMKDATGFGAGDIGQLVNTHANGDHTFGNRLVANARIIASAAGAAEMAHEGSPELLAGLMSQTAQLGRVGKYLDEIFGGFDFAGVKLRLPDVTFTGRKSLKVGDKDVELIEVGPAHTAGDTLIYAAKDRVVYTGDILFIEGTPIMWRGPIENWLAACDRIVAMDVDVIVPGHGPLTNKAGVKKMREYLAFVDAEARRRHAAGMDAWAAAQDIALGEFGSWKDAERLAVTVDTIYREIDKQAAPANVMSLFDRMAQLHARSSSHEGRSH